MDNVDIIGTDIITDGGVTLNLANQSCIPCDSRSQSMPGEDIARYLTELDGWQLEIVDDVPRIFKRYAFPNFAQALQFTNGVGALAEMENHHPRITTEWGQVRVDWLTQTEIARVDDLFTNFQ